MEPMEQSPPAVADEAKHIALPAWLTMFGGHAADAATTIHALRGGGVKEGNGIYGAQPSAGKIIGMKALGAGLNALLMKALEARGKTTAANLVGYGSGAALAGVAGWNYSQAKKAQENK